jgi:hypothetical protein
MALSDRRQRHANWRFVAAVILVVAFAIGTTFLP